MKILIILAILLQIVTAGPLTAGVTYAVCTAACCGLGAFAFAYAAASANPGAGLPVPAAGSGVYVTCAGMCDVIVAMGLFCPSP